MYLGVVDTMNIIYDENWLVVESVFTSGFNQTTVPQG